MQSGGATMFRKRAATPWRETAACRRGERRWGGRAARRGRPAGQQLRERVVDGALFRTEVEAGQGLEESRPQKSDPTYSNDPGWTVFHLPSTPGSIPAVRSHLCGHDLHIHCFKGMLGRARAGPKGWGVGPGSYLEPRSAGTADCGGSAPSASSPASVRSRSCSTAARPRHTFRLQLPTTIRGVPGRYGAAVRQWNSSWT